MTVSRYIRYIILALVGLFTACEDKIPFDDMVIGEGESSLSMEISLHTLDPALHSRAAGNAVENIDVLWAVIYQVEADGSTSLFRKILASGLPDYQVKNVDDTREDPDAEGDKTVYPDDVNFGGNIEPVADSTPRATFKINGIPYGRYKIYAVANIADLPDEVCATEETLRSHRCEWNTDVTKDNQMFGFFTPDDKRRSGGFEADVITVKDVNLKLHSWIRRLVSKVTVSFDPSELKESVRIYVKSVTIRDIPLACSMGEYNTPTTADSLISYGDSFTYYEPGKEADSDHESWSMVLSKGSGPQGEVKHTNTDPALYFFENMQGNFEGQKQYLKNQITTEGDEDRVGTAIDSLAINETTGNVNDFKDRRPYGTYIEVEAFYDSRNKQKISQGPIKYRFMLGKNTTYNYDAERNYHYKLTLKFRGWGNEADWHISYVEHTPTFITPEPYYISYLYNQKMEFPVRVLTGDDNVKNYIVKAEIVENNWWPYDKNVGTRPGQFVPSDQKDINGFAWNTGSFNNIYKYQQYTYAAYSKDPELFLYQKSGDDVSENGSNYVGFLSLKECADEVIGDPYPNPDPNGYGPSAKEFLRDYYYEHKLAEGTYYLNGAGATFDNIDKSVSLLVPMYTRNRAMVPGTDFTANNPFGYYWRYAKVRWTLYRQGDDKPVEFQDEYGKKATERISTIYQVPRIENPKVIYRAHNNDAAFDVKLMVRPNGGSSTYQMFKSDGPWRASILCQTEPFIEITSKDGVTKTAVDDYITGVTDDYIEFTYKPKGKIAANKTRCGIIKVEYHDYNCVHLIFVRQGYHGGVELGGNNWSSYNVYATSMGGTAAQQSQYAPGTPTSVKVELTRSPLSIGSYLKRNQYNYSIREENNKTFGWLESVTDKSLSTAYITAEGTVGTRSAVWGNIQGYGWTNYSGSAADERVTKMWADTWTSITKFPDEEDNPDVELGTEFDVPTGKDYERLRDECEFGFGIAYADGSTVTASNFTDTGGFIDYNNDGKDDDRGDLEARGMKVCVVYERNTGKNMIFPLSSLGQGRRSLNGAFVQHTTEAIPFPSNLPSGTLIYGGIASPLYNTARNAFNIYRPLTFNLYRAAGAVYWVKQPMTTDEHCKNTSDNFKNTNCAYYASWDLNYFSIRFTTYTGSLAGWDDESKTYTNSGVNKANACDALPIRLIYKKK